MSVPLRPLWWAPQPGGWSAFAVDAIRFVRRDSDTAFSTAVIILRESKALSALNAGGALDATRGKSVHLREFA